MSDDEVKPKQKRGFAAMSEEKRREIARLGGIRSHQKGVGHKFTSESGIAAGLRSGLVRAKKQVVDESTK